MRILLFGYLTEEMGGRGTGGVATYIKDIASNLRRLGHDVAVWGDNAKFWKKEWEGITLYGAPSKYSLPFEWLSNPTFKIKRRWLWRSRGIRILKDFRPDVFHSHSPHHWPTYDLPIVPLVVTFHSIHFYSFASSPRRRKEVLESYRKSIDRASYVLFPSSKAQSELLSLMDVKKPQKIIHPRVDTSIFHPLDKFESRKILGLPLEGTLVGFAGLLTGRKGEDLLVRASRGKDWILVFAGGGPKLKDTERMCREQRCTAVFLGDLKRDDMVYFYNALDVFVLPSRSETFGMVVVEAMACGKTVVVSEEVPQDVAPHHLAYRVPLDPDALENAISRALNSPQPSELLIAHARKFSDMMLFAKEHLKVYKKVLKM